MALFGKKKKSHDNPAAPAKARSLPDDIDSRYKVVFNSKGLLPVIIQNSENHQVMRLGYMDRRAYTRTMDERRLYLYRRSRKQIEQFGERRQFDYEIESMHLDRSYRSLLVKVRPLSDPTKMHAFVHPINFPDSDSEDTSDDND